MDFKTFTIIRGDELQLRAKNPYKFTSQAPSPEWIAFETFANSHTYTLANHKDLPEGVTEVKREEVDEPEWQYLSSDGWVGIANKETLSYIQGQGFDVRQVVYYSPKQEREEEKHPEKCPVTGKKFFMLIEDESGEIVPTYGGPFDSYTIPVKDEDGEYCTERYCHDSGAWMGIEGIEVEEQEKPKEEESLEQLEERARLLDAQIDSLDDELRDVNRKIYWIKNPFGGFCTFYVCRHITH